MRDIPTTDPVASREMAARLRTGAERVHDLARRLALRLAALAFQGPAALRLRAEGVERKLRANQIAGELRDVATGLSHGGETC